MKGFQPIRVFPSSRGLHFEFETEKEAIAFHQQGENLGDRDEIVGNMVIILASNSADLQKSKSSIIHIRD